jgi:hypothetical protein
MALPVTLADVGYYLLWAIGLILLLIFILSAMALLLTRIDLFSKHKISRTVFLNKIRLSFHLLFLKYNAVDTGFFYADDSAESDSKADDSKADDSKADDPKADDSEATDLDADDSDSAEFKTNGSDSADSDTVDSVDSDSADSAQSDSADSDSADSADDSKDKQTFASQGSESKAIEKYAGYVTKTGEEIKIKTIQYQNQWEAYDVVIEILDKDENQDEKQDGKLDENQDEESEKIQSLHFQTKISDSDISDSDLEDETPPLIEETDFEGTDFESAESEDAESEDTNSKNTDSENIDFEDIDLEDIDLEDIDFEDIGFKDIESEINELLHDLDDLAGSYDEIQKYVDLSNPKQFVSDSLTAGSKISASSARFIGALLLRTNLKKLSLNLDYGLSDPADTAVSYGITQSFIAGIYAYLDTAAQRSRSSRKRKRCREIVAQIQNNVVITPALMEKKINIESELSGSFWIVRLYIPLIRFLINRDTRWFLRRYVWVYYIKHNLKRLYKEYTQKKAPASNAAP